MGFLTDDMTYHSKMSSNIQNILSRNYCPTSLYIRTRADRIAAHSRYPLIFQWEAKTHTSRKYHDWTLEVFPLMVHKINAETFGIRCLYVYFNPLINQEAAFWSNNIPPLRCIMIPGRQTNNTDLFIQCCNRCFPKTEIIEGFSTNGSGDPFAIIDKSTVDFLPTGIDLIKNDLSVFERLT